MITFLEGDLAEKHPTHIVVAVGGVGYEVFIPLSSYEKLPEQGASCRVLIYDYFREDNRLLFGFCSQVERNMFAQLMSVTGIGPKLALSALSSLSVREITLALAEGDAKRLSSISGVGKKVAERLIVELRGKITPTDALAARAGDDGAPDDTRLRDAVMALIALGYKQADARSMLQRVGKKVEPGMAVEDIVRLALTG